MGDTLSPCIEFRDEGPEDNGPIQGFFVLQLHPSLVILVIYGIESAMLVVKY